MDRANQDTFLLSDLGAIGTVEADGNDVVSQQTNEVHTVYTHLPSVLEESGYRQIYVTVDNPNEIASLARSFSSQQAVGINQPSIVTVTVPTSQLVRDSSGTLIIQSGGIAVAPEATSIVTEQDQIKSKDEYQPQVVFSEGDTVTVDTRTSLSQLTEKGPPDIHLGDQKTVSLVIEKSIEETAGDIDVASSTTAKDLVELIAGSETSDGKKAPPIPLVVCRCDSRRDNVKTAQQIFTSVQANLASQLMDKIPGCTATFLHQFTVQHDMQLQQPNDPSDSLQVSGELHKLLCLHDNLSQLISATTPSPRSPTTKRHETLPPSNNSRINSQHQTPSMPTEDGANLSSDKAVHCDILQPQYSRSGRQIKRRNLDHPMDKGEAANAVVSDPNYVPSSTTTKRKRGRPAKKSKPKEVVPAPTKDLVLDGSKKEDADQLPYTSIEDALTGVISSQVCSDITGAKSEVQQVTPSIVDAIGDCVPQLPPDIIVDPVPSQDHLTKESTLSIIKDVPTPPTISDEELPDPCSLSEKENSQVPSTLEGGPIVSKDAEGHTTLKMRKVPTSMILGRKRHKKDYESLAPYKFHCSLCSFKSKRKSHYLKHLQIHTKKSLPVLQCAQCNFTTIRLSHLRRHQLTHSANIYTCKVCSYKTDDMKRLNRHHRIKHMAAQPEPEMNVVYQCDQCEYKTLKSHQFARHLRCHSTLCPDSAGQTCSSYQCPLCPYKTQRKEHYSRHVANVHTDRRPYLCDLCGKAFKRPDALRQHKLIHQDKHTRPFRYSCQDCLKGFRSHAHLVEHRTIHTDERSYLCEICGAAFKTRSVQRKHVQTIHQNPRAHSCSSCDKRFNTKYALQRHLRTHNTPGMRTLSLAMEELGGNTTVAILPASSDTAQIIQELHETAAGDDEDQAIVAQPIAAEGTVATVEHQYEETTDGTVRQLPQTAYIQATSEETTALLYLTSLPTY